MHLKSFVLALAALRSRSSTSTPPGFEPSTSQILGVRYNTTNVSPGVLLPSTPSPNGPYPAVTEFQPALRASLPIPGRKATVIMIDLDAPSPTNQTFSPILHWIQTDLVAVGDAYPVPLTSNDTASLAPYRFPRPPTPPPHRYVFLLFQQPADFAVPETFPNFTDPNVNRRNFNYAAFIEDSHLGQLLEANYFRVGNLSTA